MNSALHTLAKVSVGVPRADESFSLTHTDSYMCPQDQHSIDSRHQSLSGRQTKCTANHLHIHPVRCGAASDTNKEARPGG